MRGPISVQPWDAATRHQGALSAGVGLARRRDLLASRRSWSSGGHSPPGFESKAPSTATRRRGRHMGPSPRCGCHFGVHLANEV